MDFSLAVIAVKRVSEGNASTLHVDRSSSKTKSRHAAEA